MSDPPPVVCVFARYPVPGEVKTRLLRARDALRVHIEREAELASAFLRGPIPAEPEQRHAA